MGQRAKLPCTLVATCLAPLLLGLSPGTAPAAPQARSDLRTALMPVACAADAPSPSTDAQLRLWQAGVYDADLVVETLSLRDRSPAFEASKLAAMASSLARRHRHLGYSFGVCRDTTKAWIASSPAPAPLGVASSKLDLPVELYAASCRELLYDFAAAADGPSESLQLASDGKTLARPSLDGMLSVTCQPRSPSWLGPRPWFLVPSTAKASLLTPPAAKVLAEAPGDAQARFTGWLNAIRRKAQLAALASAATKPALVDAVTSLSLGSSLEHDRALMETVGRNLKQQSWQAIGENRVRGRSLSQLASLLWYSPRHRRLLLNREATHVVTSIQEAKGDLFLVMLLARPNLNELSKRAEPPAKAARL